MKIQTIQTATTAIITAAALADYIWGDEFWGWLANRKEKRDGDDG